MNANFPRDLQTITHFEVTQEHLALLKRTHISYDHQLEFGAPIVDPKRPYGNSGVYADLAEILDITPTQIVDDEPELSDDQMSTLLRLHHEMAVVIQILTINLSIDVGPYHRPSPYDVLGWMPATDSGSPLVLTSQQIIAVEDALRDLDPEEATWPTGEQIEAIAHALSTTKADDPDAPTSRHTTPAFYTLPAGRLIEGLSTDDGQDIISVTTQGNNVTAEVYTPRLDDLEIDEHNRANSEMRSYRLSDDVDLAIFPDTKIDGRGLAC